MGTSQVSMETSQVPTGTFQFPMGTSQVSMETSQVSMETSQVPMGTSQVPMGTSQVRDVPWGTGAFVLGPGPSQESAKLSEVSTHLGPERAETPTLAAYLQTVASPAAAHLGCAGIAQYTPVGRLWEELWFAPDQSRIPRNHPNPELFSKIDRSQTRIFRPSRLRRDCAIHSRGATLGGALVRS